MKLFDVHTHVQLAALNEDREDVIKRAQEKENYMINVGTQWDTSSAAIDLAKKYESGVWATIGLHPIHTSKSFHDKQEIGEGGEEFTSRGEVFDYDYYLQLGKDEKVVGIGECGLDYYRLTRETCNAQCVAFEKQIE